MKLVFIFCGFFFSIVGVRAKEQKRITNAADAIATAEPALIAKFGREEIDRQRPFRVRIVREKDKPAIWVVEGTDQKAPKGTLVLGGVVYVSIRESDGKILEIFMWK